MMTLNSFSKEQIEAGRLKAEKNRNERKKQGLSAYKNPPESLRKAIYECVGMDGDVNFRQTIRECLCTDCPLYPVRPYQPK